MIVNIIIVLLVVLLLIVAFFIGLFTGFSGALDIVENGQCEDEIESQMFGDLYCFECEIEMPVKEKDGQLHCKNCGLLHTNNYC